MPDFFKSRIKLCRLCILSFAGFLLFLSLPGWSVAKAFNYMELGVSAGSVHLMDTIYKERWNTSPSLGYNLKTDFYIGVVGVSVAHYRYKAINENIPRVRANNYSLYWGIKPIEFSRLGLTTGISTGIFSNEVPRPDRPGYKTPLWHNWERETHMSLHTALRFDLGSVLLFSELQVEKVFNYHRKHLFFINSGVKINLLIPEGIKNVIK